MIFHPSQIETFRFIGWTFDERNGLADFAYAFDDKPIFVERLAFNGFRSNLSDEEQIALGNCFHHLHLMLGISYYKAATPSNIVIEGYDIPEKTAHFFEDLYLNGLAEFAYKNQMDLRGRIHFPSSPHAKCNASDVKLHRRTAVPVGGGKDSVVTIEALKAYREDSIAFALGDFAPICKVIDRSGLPRIVVKRSLSQNLFEINSQGAFNGHVPISAIIAFLLPVCSILYGFDSAALSNERSASAGNFFIDGFEVNHQYSKGYEFERKVSDYMKASLLSGFQYFSFLRPASELAIAQLFSKCISYHSVFTSCNSAFKLNKNTSDRLWCLACPKCRSTFLLLAPFMKKDAVLKVFGENLLDCKEHVRGFEELTGMSGHKPFECVGEQEEYIAAFTLLQNNPEWNNDLVVRYFSSRVLPRIPEKEQILENVFSFSAQHLLSSKYERILYAYSRS
jgi:hypothetical protein